MDPETYRILFEAQGKNGTVKLINTYRGVPVIANGQLFELHGNDAKIRANALQIISIRNQKITHLHFGYRIIKARLLNSDLNQEIIQLTDFEICKNIIGLRKFIRIEPENPIKAQVSSVRFNKGDANKNEWYNTKMVDLSIHGTAINLHNLILKQTPIYVDDSATLKFNLTDPTSTEPFQIEVKVLIRNIKPSINNSVRLGLETFPNPITENFLTRYIALQQKIIIQELKERLDRDMPLPI
jgi:hypothetical protein